MEDREGKDERIEGLVPRVLAYAAKEPLAVVVVPAPKGIDLTTRIYWNTTDRSDR